MSSADLVSITLKDIGVKVLIGAWAKERKKPQELWLDVKIDYHASMAIKSDAMEDAVDYYKLTTNIITHVEQTQYYLLERLLHDVLQFIMQDQRILACQVDIHKPMAMKKLGVKTTVSGRMVR
jgi:FolB domain-containing protein